VSANPDAEWIYGYSEGAGTPDIARPFIDLPVPGDAWNNINERVAPDWGGTWELLMVQVICITAGGVPIAATIAPVIAHHGDKDYVLYPAPAPVPAAYYQATPPAQSAYLLKSPGPVCFVNADIFGDSFFVRSMWRRRQSGG